MRKQKTGSTVRLGGVALSLSRLGKCRGQGCRPCLAKEAAGRLALAGPAGTRKRQIEFPLILLWDRHQHG